MSNLFRIKVIESNGKYRDFIESELIKKEQELEEESVVVQQEESKDDSMNYDDQISDDEMQVEFLNDFLNAVEAADTIQLVKAPPKKIIKQDSSQSKKEITPQATESPSKVQKEQPSNKVCFVCTEPATEHDLFAPFKKILNRIVPLRNCKLKEYLCPMCVKKLEDAHQFFTKLDSTTTVKSDCCQFCSGKVSPVAKTPKHAIETFFLLDESERDFKLTDNAKICAQCVQLLKRIRMLRNSYNAKERFYEKRHRSNNNDSIPRKRQMTRKRNNTIDSPMAVTSPSSRRKARKRFRTRANPKYVEPDPNEPVPENFQCHMSDLEEIESDFEVPAVPFRFPLNVPFKQRYLDCPDCTVKFVNSCEMDVHYNIVHNTKSEKCDICQKVFKDVKTVKDHKISVHTNDFSAFNFRKLCDICGLAKRKFENHYVIHFDVRAFKCQLCSCDYKTKTMLEDHIRTVHMGEKRHKCVYCEKRFSYAADKARHEIGVHTKKFKHICQFCGKCFLKKNFLTAHQKSQHAEMLLELKTEVQE